MIWFVKPYLDWAFSKLNGPGGHGSPTNSPISSQVMIKLNTGLDRGILWVKVFWNWLKN